MARLLQILSIALVMSFAVSTVVQADENIQSEILALQAGDFERAAHGLEPVWGRKREPLVGLKLAAAYAGMGDTRARPVLREIILSRETPDWILVDATRLLIESSSAFGDTVATLGIMRRALTDPARWSAGRLELFAHATAFSDDEKLDVFGQMLGVWKDQNRPVILVEVVRILRNARRHEQALLEAGTLSRLTGSAEHRVLMVEILLDMNRRADARALAFQVAKEFPGLQDVYDQMAERFRRSGEFTTALDLYDAARVHFQNASVFLNQASAICEGLGLNRRGVELYLPTLLQAPNQGVPGQMLAFLNDLDDTAYFDGPYLAAIRQGINQHLFLESAPKLARVASRAALLDYARTFHNKFGRPQMHLALAAELGLSGRQDVFRELFDDLPDTPAELWEHKQLIRLRVAIPNGEARELERQFDPEKYHVPEVAENMHRLLGEKFLSEDKLSDAEKHYGRVYEIGRKPEDMLMLSRLSFTLGDDTAALARAHQARQALPNSEEAWVWSGFLSLVNGDTLVAAQALRHALKTFHGPAGGEALAWLMALIKSDEPPGRALAPVVRALRQKKSWNAASISGLPELTRVHLWRERLTARPADAPSMTESAYARAIHLRRYTELGSADPSALAALYAELIRAAPEHLRELIRVDAPASARPSDQGSGAARPPSGDRP